MNIKEYIVYVILLYLGLVNYLVEVSFISLPGHHRCDISIEILFFESS